MREKLQSMALEDERVQLVWASASEGNVFAAAVDKMTEEVRALGQLRWQQSVVSENGHVAPVPEVAAAEAEEA